MLYHRQSNLDPGNCLQTCVACILEVPIAAILDQCVIDRDRYLAALKQHLADTHAVDLVRAQPGTILSRRRLAHREYVMCGSMRGPLGGIAEEHCVVARDYQVVWDPYPTHPGLPALDYLLLLERRP